MTASETIARPEVRVRPLPARVTVACAALAALGFHWDIAWHTDFVRDRFLTAPHLTIAAGLLGVLAAAWLRGRADPSGSAVAAARRSPGAALSLVSAVATGVTLNVDNWWHILFGFDLTLWSPPHLVLSLGFLAMFLGGLRELREQGAEPHVLAAVPGMMFATATLLVLEFELGFLHYDMRWEALALGAFTAATLALAAAATGLAWAGTIAGVAGAAARLAALGVNAALGAPLPTPPVGILVAGLAFDLARHAALRRHAPRGVALTLAAVACWPPMLVVTAVLRLTLGRTWWTPEVTLLALPLGTLGAAAGAFVGRRAGWFVRGTGAAARSSSSRRLARALLAGAVATAIVGSTGLVVLDARSPELIEARITRDGRSVALTVPGATEQDWAVLIGGRPERPHRTTWLGSLRWRDGALVGPFPDGELTWLGVWFEGRDHAWINLGVLESDGPIVLARDAFRSPDAPPVDAASVVVSYLLLLVLVTVQVGYVATGIPTRRALREEGSRWS